MLSPSEIKSSHTAQIKHCLLEKTNEGNQITRLPNSEQSTNETGQGIEGLKYTEVNYITKQEANKPSN